MSRVYLQKVYSYLREDRSWRRWWQPMWTVENTKARGFRPMKTKNKGFFLRNK